MAEELSLEDLMDQHEPDSSGGLYLKLKDKDTVKIRFVSVPYIYENNYQGKISKRYAWVVVNRETGKAMVLQLSGTTFDQLKGLVKDPDWGDYRKYDIKLSRSGSDKDTTYALNPSPKSTDLTKEELASVEEVDMTKAITNAVLLSDYVKTGKLPADNREVTASGDVILTDLPEDGKNPLDGI